MFIQKLRALWKIRELRFSVLSVLGIIAVFRIAAHIPIPGVNPENLRNFFQSNQILGLLNIFSGGGIENFSIVALGVGPYITASIIVQLLTMIIPKLEEMQKETGGYEKMNRWMRYMTVPLAALQGFGLISLLRSQSSYQIISSMTTTQTVLTVLTLTAGTVFLMWLGELISDKGLGSGISLIIFAGIVASFPGILQRFLATYDSSQLLTVIVFAIILVVTIIAVVLINEATRNIPVSYARHTRMGGGGAVNTYLPLRINAAGMIPIIFAMSLILFPSLIAQFTVQAKSEWLSNASQWVINVTQNQTIYGIAYFVAVFFFTYFYSSIVFKPQQISENLQKQGGFVPGIRPGEHTKEYLEYVSTRLLFTGALFLSLIAVLPIILQQTLQTGSLVLASSSLLIVVSVVIESVKQIEAQITMRDYEI